MDIAQSSEDLLKVFEYPFNETVLLLLLVCMMIGFCIFVKKLWVQVLSVCIGLIAALSGFLLYFHEISERNEASQDYGEEVIAELNARYYTDGIQLVTKNVDEDSKGKRHESIAINEPSSDLRAWASSTSHKFVFDSARVSLVEVKINDEYYVYGLTKLGDDLTLVLKHTGDPSPMKFKKN